MFSYIVQEQRQAWFVHHAKTYSVAIFYVYVIMQPTIFKASKFVEQACICLREAPLHSAQGSEATFFLESRIIFVCFREPFKFQMILITEF
jgi:hypothetical protein